MKKPLLTLLIVLTTAFWLCGCESESPSPPIQPKRVIVLPTTREAIGTGMTASGGEYTREITAVRGGAIMGPTPAAVIESIKPFEQKGLTLPTYDPNTGLLTGATQAGFKGGESKPTGILHQLWNVVKRVLLIYCIVVVVLIPLSLYPFTAPFALPLLKFLISWIPGAGAGIIAWIASARTKSVQAAADFNYRGWTQTAAAINAWRLKHPDLWDEMKSVLKSFQDRDIQDAIDRMNTPG